MSKKSANSRKITESFPQVKSVSQLIRHEITLFSTLFFTLCLGFLLVVAAWFYFNYQDEKSKWLAARDNLWYWQEVAAKQVNSPDAYYQAALYAAELGENQQAYLLLQKALDLDAGFEKAKKLQEELITP